MLDCPKEILVGQGSGGSSSNSPLVYITYMKDGKVYKEKSFDGWRNKAIPVKTFKNEPQQGFKVLFTVGGCKSGWDVRQTYFRVQDPRGFEFEITSSNFVNILQKETITEGVLSRKYAYVWEGQNFRLIEETDPVYIEGVKNNTALNSEDETVTKDNIVLGQGYRLRDHENGYYIGRLPWKTYRGKEKENEDGQELPKTEYKLEQQLMYTFVIEVYDYDKKGKVKGLAGYYEIKNVKFKNTDNYISADEVEKEIAEFYLSPVGKAPETIDWKYELKKEHELKDNWSKKYHPEYYQTYDEWIKTPIDNCNERYQTAHFVVDTGDSSHFKSVISFKFPTGNIHNYVYDECIFTPEKITVDKQVTPYRIGSDDYYRNHMTRYKYETFIHYGIKEFTETDKLIPYYGLSYILLDRYNVIGIYNGKRYGLTVNIPKAYHKILYK